MALGPVNFNFYPNDSAHPCVVWSQTTVGDPSLVLNYNVIVSLSTRKRVLNQFAENGPNASGHAATDTWRVTSVSRLSPLLSHTLAMPDSEPRTPVSAHGPNGPPKGMKTVGFRRSGHGLWLGTSRIGTSQGMDAEIPEPPGGEREVVTATKAESVDESGRWP